MLCIDSKIKKRQELYIETYKNMVMDLCEENLLNIKIKEEEEINEQNNNINNIIIQILIFLFFSKNIMSKFFQ